MPRDTVRLGLVGAGRWGKNYIRTIAALNDVQLGVVASRNPETAALVPAGCRVVADWHALVGDGDIDGVVIASPPDTHADILIAAVERGKAVLAEKPVVTSRGDAARVRETLARRAATVMVDHTHLFHPAFRALCREAATLGPVRSIKSSAGNHGPYRRDASILWDWAPHDVAMCLALLPGHAHVEQVLRTDTRIIEDVPAERIVLDLRLAGDVSAQITVSTLDDRHRWFAAECDLGTLVFRDFVAEKLVRLAPGDTALAQGGVIVTGSQLPLTRAVIEFAERIRAGNSDRHDIELGLAVVELIAEAADKLEASS